MFERYVEKARRVIFFARYEASQLGSPMIETEHLLLGLLREDKPLANRFLRSSAAIDSIRRQIEEHTVIRQNVSTSVDLPLSHDSKRVLAYAGEESERMHHKTIDTPHLWLGLLREENSFAAASLREHGIQLAPLREEVIGFEPESSDMRAPRRQPSRTLVELLFAWEASGGVTVAAWPAVGNYSPDFAIYAGGDVLETGQTKLREQYGLAQSEGGKPIAPTPFLCIETLREESLSNVRMRFEDYLAGGVAQVWALDFRSKRAYTVTAAEGLREFKGEILRMEPPAVELDLKKAFS